MKFELTDDRYAREPDQVGRFDDHGGRTVSPPRPKGWVMTEDGWKQLARPPWSAAGEYPAAGPPYWAPMFGKPLSGPAAAALTAANAQETTVEDRTDTVETRTHRVVANKPSGRKLARNSMFLRRLAVVACAPPVVAVAAVISAFSIAHMLAVGLTISAVRITMRDGLADLGAGWSGLFELFAERWAR